ncbi:hypothetical protein A3768_4223 (plasmid) [Ralstonia solanacearum]|nr:hypothetical protein A3768_4223 [Ralstonia solanacearum]
MQRIDGIVPPAYRSLESYVDVH